VSVAARASLPVYLEIGTKRTFAGAVEWPGWARSGRDEAGALETLLRYLPRYRAALGTLARRLAPSSDVDDLDVVERLDGNSTTDFGAPGVPPAADTRPLGDAELARLLGLYEASWRAFDRAARAARGMELAKGPRGGGRELDAIVRHVLNSDAGYLHALGVSYRGEGDLGPKDAAPLRRAVLAALRDAPRDGPPPVGPRGGKRWTVRYFIRRSAWHALDHAWEIEDRSGSR
jgi:hypothetical protein